MRNRRSFFRFTEKTHSKRGIAAFLLAAALVALYAFFVVWAYWKDSALSMYFGSAGVAAFLLSLAAFFLAVASMREESSYMLYPRLALLTSLLALLCWGGTYVWGLL